MKPAIIRHPRYALFLAILLTSGPLLAIAVPLYESLLIGFDLAVAGYALSCARLWHGGTVDVLRKRAADDDAGLVLLVLLSLLIGSIVLVSLGILVLAQQQVELATVALVVVTMAACWLFVNLIHAFHYAHLYFYPLTNSAGQAARDRGGLEFPGGHKPDFSDFVNFAFVIGMTCQTADITITARAIRRATTLHALFAFVFNLGILALCVNVLASGEFV